VLVANYTTIYSWIPVTGQTNIQVLDLTGKVAMNERNYSWENNAIQLNLEALKSGVYFIQIHDAIHGQPLILKCIRQ
jgi:hypothetical protein